MSTHTNARKHPAAKNSRRIPATRANTTAPAQPASRRRVSAKHVTHVAGGVGTAVMLETAARLICEHVLPVAMPFLH